MADPAKLGGKLGPRVADLMARAATSHLLQSADTRARIQRTATLDVFRTITAETRTTIAPLFRELARDPELTSWTRDTLHFLGHGQGELQALVSALTTASSLTPGIGELISNDLGPTIQNLISKNPHALLSPGDAARAVVVGLWGDDHGVLEAARGGLSANRFETLVSLAESFPDVGTLLELLRRGEVDHDYVAQALNRQGFARGTANELLKLRRVHLQPADAADMVLRGIIDRQAGHDVARINGLATDDFDKLSLAVGEPPAIEELLFLYRRGRIDKAKLAHGIRQSRVRDEWIDEIEALQHRPMDVGSALAAVVQGHLPEAEGRRRAEENGLDPGDWTPMLETHGRPPGTEEMLSLYNRGVISKARVEQAIRESDIKNKYIPDLIEIRRHLLPQRTVVSMHSKGALTDREALDHLLNLGISRPDAEALVKEGTATKTAGQRQLAEGTLLSLYEAATIDRKQAHDALQALGYTGEEIGWILAFAELRKSRAERDHAISVLRSRYVGWHLDDAEVSGALDTLRVPTSERDRLVGFWRLERAASVRRLTEAQVIRALKKQVIDQPTAEAKLAQLGYSQEDLSILIASA